MDDNRKRPHPMADHVVSGTGGQLAHKITLATWSDSPGSRRVSQEWAVM
jgi:hypothetical protein